MLRDRIAFYSPAQIEYNRVVAENPAAAAQFSTWFVNQKSLVNTGDQGFQNASNLLAELRGRDINSQTIHEAIGRINAPTSKFDTRKRPKLSYAQAPRRTEPVSRAAKEDDGTPFLGDLVKTSDGGFRSKTPIEQRREREAAERAKSSQTQTSTLDASEQAWKRMADELLRDGTHGQQDRVRAVYNREQGNGWRRIYEACKREVNLSKNRGVR